MGMSLAGEALCTSTKQPCTSLLRQALRPWGSVATVQADIFHKISCNLINKIDKITRIFEDMDDPKNRGVIPQL
jgi:hypothetical protein